MPTSARRAFASTCVALATLAGLAASAAGQTVLYVNVNLATGNDDGSSWENAFRTRDGVNRALAAALPNNTQIWVARGVYVPTLTSDRTISHNLRAGVELYGGFVGGETQLTQRDLAANPTILSGDILGDDQPYPATQGWLENSYHVVRGDGPGVQVTAAIDGFVIRQGHANTSGLDQDRGGGMIFLNAATPRILNCVITNNRVTFGGGAVYIRGASPSFTNVDMNDNFGGSFGGAVDAANTGTPIFVACRFRRNQAGRAGGVELFSGMNAALTNCLFQDNVATGATGGGAMFISGSSPTIRHCTIAYNRATTSAAGGGLVLSGSNAVVRNSVLWGNQGTGQPVSISGTANVEYSCVQNGFAGAGNIAADPLFVSTGPTGDLRLQLASPAIDAASNLESGAGNTTDLDGNPRFVDIASVPDTGVPGGVGGPAIADMGAYETRPGQCYPNCDGSTGNPLLTPADFVCFLNRFRAGDAYANCDGSTGNPALTPADFVCFLSRFRAGC